MPTREQYHSPIAWGGIPLEASRLNHENCDVPVALGEVAGEFLFLLRRLPYNGWRLFDLCSVPKREIQREVDRR